MTDVVKAYKGIVNEKEALEASLQALTSQTTTSEITTPSRNKLNNDSEHEPTSDDQLSNIEEEQGKLAGNIIII